MHYLKNFRFLFVWSMYFLFLLAIWANIDILIKNHKNTFTSVDYASLLKKITFIFKFFWTMHFLFLLAILANIHILINVNILFNFFLYKNIILV